MSPSETRPGVRISYYILYFKKGLLMEDPLDDEDEAKDKTLPVLSEKEVLYQDIALDNNILTNSFKITYTKDQIDSFNQFVELAKYDPPDLKCIDETSTLPEVIQSDAQMLYKQAMRLHLGINKIRTINDVVSINKALIDFMYARRELICDTKPKAEDDWGKPL